MKRHFNDTFGDFKCIHCRGYVSADIDFSGVLHRNHCPYCLWSKHLDLLKAGDRLCACKGPMQPIGLTLKQARKKYGGETQGELMLIHQCIECGKISINRIAADDVSETLLEVFEDGKRLSEPALALILQNGVQALREEDTSLVYARLFGWQAPALVKPGTPYMQAAGYPAAWSE